MQIIQLHFQGNDGVSASYIPITIYNDLGPGLATIYNPQTGQPMANPIMTDIYGNIGFQALDGKYTALSVINGLSVTTYIQLFDTSATTAAASVTSTGPSNVQADIDGVKASIAALPTFANLAAPGGAALIGKAGGGTVQDAINSSIAILPALAASTGATLIGTSDGNNAQVELNLKPTNVVSVAALRAMNSSQIPGGIVNLQSWNLNQWQGGGTFAKLAVPTTDNGVTIINTSDAASFQRLNLSVPDVYMGGAVGDGAVDDTAACQRVLNLGGPVYFPKPSVNFKISSLTVQPNQTITGPGKWVTCIVGDGTADVFVCGDGTGTPRNMSLFSINVTNSGHRALFVNNAPGFTMSDCFMSTTGSDCASLVSSYRVFIKNNRLLCSGAFVALKAMNNINGFDCADNTISGGTSGRAIQVGQSQAIRINNNIIESSLDGIWIASSADVGEGNCNGVECSNNYFEQCSTPLVLGKTFSVLALECHANYISNANTSVVATRTAAITFGRIRSGSITDNIMYILPDVEDAYNIYLITATGDIEQLEVARNRIIGTPANYYQTLGAFGANTGVLRLLGGLNNILLDGYGSGFKGTGSITTTVLTITAVTSGTISVGDTVFGTGTVDTTIITSLGTGTGGIGTYNLSRTQTVASTTIFTRPFSMGSNAVYEYVSPTITSNVGIALTTWLPFRTLKFGGKIQSVELIENNGTAVSGTLSLGRVSSAADTVNQDLSLLTLANGCATIPLVTASALIFSTENNTIRHVAGATAGTFRIRVRYRVS